MFKNNFEILLMIVLAYYLIGCVVKIIGIILDNTRIINIASIIFYLPISIVLFVVSFVLAFLTGTIIGIKDVISDRILCTGGAKAARKVMEEIEAEEDYINGENRDI